MTKLFPSKRRESHHCFLVGGIHNGISLPHSSRRVIYVDLNERTIQTSDVIAVKQFHGKVLDVHLLGTVTVPIEDNMDLVQRWIQEVISNTDRKLSNEIITDNIKARIAEVGMSPPIKNVNTILEILEATIVNQSPDRVFGPARDPSSFT